MRKNFTDGSVIRNIFIFSLLYPLSYLLQTLYGMADLYIIGQFGNVADSSSVSIGSQVMHMFTVMIVGLAMGATVFIGQLVIAKQKNLKRIEHKTDNRLRMLEDAKKFYV